MPTFLIVDATAKQLKPFSAPSTRDACVAAGLNPDETDHGQVTLSRKTVTGIIVAEFGMFEPIAQQKYFAIGGHLYAGNAVLYTETLDPEAKEYLLDTEPLPPGALRFVDDPMVEIEQGRVLRPQQSAGGEIMWQFPGPRPGEDVYDKHIERALDEMKPKR